MMRKKIKFLLLLQFVIQITTAQLPTIPYEPVSWDGLERVWYDTAHDSAAINDFTDGYNYFLDWYIKRIKPIIQGDYVYSLYNSRGQLDDCAGAYFEKRNIYTGELVWYATYNVEAENNRQEVPRLIYLNEEDNLVVLGVKRVAPYDVNDPHSMWGGGSRDMRFTERIYDRSDGSLLYYYDPDLVDTTIAVLRTVRSRRSAFVSFDNRIEANEYRYFAALPDGIDSFRIRYFDIDHKGRMRSAVDTVKMQKNSFGVKLEKYGEDGYLYIDNENYHGDVTFYFLDNDFNIVKEVEADTIKNRNGGVLVKWMGKERVILSNYVYSHPSGQYPVYDLCLYDMEGNLLKQSRMDEEPVYWDSYAPIPLETGDDLYVLAFFRLYFVEDRYFTALDVLKANDDYGFDIVNRFRTTDRLRSGSPYRATVLENGNIMVHLHETLWIETSTNSGYKISHDAGSHARSIMVVTQEALGINLSTATEDVTYIYDNKVSIYPNPAEQYLHCNFDQRFTGYISIYDMVGNKIKTTIIHESDYAGIQVSHLAAGNYLALFTSFDEKELIQPEKFVKL